MSSQDGLHESLNRLPVFSPLLQRVLHVLADENSNTTQLAEVIKYDPLLVARLLRLANSVYLGVPNSVSSVNHAVALLGRSRIRSAVVISGLLGQHHQPLLLPYKLADFWRHSVAAALIAQSLGRHLKRYCVVDPDELFCAGLMHDIGRLVLGLCEPQRLSAAVASAAQSGLTLHAAETPQVNHQQAGAVLAHHWGFAPPLVAAIGLHHDPLQAEHSCRHTVWVIHGADFMAHSLGFQTIVDEVPPQLSPQAVESIGLPLERLKVIASEMLADRDGFESLYSALL
jgi:HD-like signal output (HDOD) protein